MRGIKRKIILNTTLLTVVLAVVTSVNLIVTANLLVSNSMTETLAPFAKTAAKSIESNLHLMADRIALISQNEVFTKQDAAPEEISAVLQNAASGIEFNWLCLYAADGSLAAQAGSGPETIADRALYQKMNDTQNLVIDNTAAGDDGLEIAVGMPILSEDQVAYYLVGAYKYNILNDIIGNIQVGRDYSAWIIDPEGTVMAHTDTEMVKNQSAAAELYKDDPEMLALLEQITQRLTGSATVEIGGAETFVSYSPVDGTNWDLAIAVPKSGFMATAKTAIEANILILLLLLVVSLLITLRFSGQIAMSLGKVTGRIQKLAEGDLTTNVDVMQTRDEAETLSVSLKNSISDISGYVQKLTYALEQLSSGNADIAVEGKFSGDFVVMKDALNNIISYLNGILTNLKQSSGTLSQSTRKVADNAAMVKNATEHQFEAIRRLEQEADGISQGAGTIDENAAKTRALMKDASERLDSGRKQMQVMLEAMEEIQRNASDVTAITKLMEDIAFQTNLLALNASVEAARAGTAGKGFVEVASEVKKLATQSAASAKSTAGIIEQTRKSIDTGSKYALETAQIIEQVAEISGDISVIADNLAVSAESTNDALSKVTGDLTVIAKFAQDNLVSSSALAAESQEIAYRAEELYKMSARFKLRGASKRGVKNV